MAVPAAGVGVVFRSRVPVAGLWLPAQAGLCGPGGGRAVAAEDLSLGSAGDGSSVGQEFDFPAPPVDADVVVELA
jgi:hypothetical protein